VNNYHNQKVTQKTAKNDTKKALILSPKNDPIEPH